MGNKICSVTTLKAPVEQTISFVNYHLNIGVDHMFLFFDDPNDKVIEILKNYKNITCFKCDEKHWEKTIGKKLIKKTIGKKLGSRYDQKRVSKLDGNKDFLLEEKQQINGNFALDIAMKRGFDWITHIDSDELIYLRKIKLKKFLKNSSPNSDVIRLPSFEAVPEKYFYKNIFKEISLFKSFGFIARFYYKHKEKLLKMFKFLKKREGNLRSIYFKGHAAGKSIVKINSKIDELGMHEPITKKGYKLNNIFDHRANLLHYDCKNFDDWKSKWASIYEGKIKVIGYNEKYLESIQEFYKAYEKKDLKTLKKIYKKQYFIPEMKKNILRLLGFLRRIKLDRKLFEKPSKII